MSITMIKINMYDLYFKAFKKLHDYFNSKETYHVLYGDAIMNDKHLSNKDKYYKLKHEIKVIKRYDAIRKSCLKEMIIVNKKLHKLGERL